MVVFIMGPTGVGKSKLAIRLAQELDGEIVSVDSALVYRGLDIGTAKPNLPERQSVPHHLIDICSPLDDYSAGRFVTDATKAVRSVEGKGRIPILVGGTNLYFRALEYGLSAIPKSDPDIRRVLQMEAVDKGVSSLHERLRAIDQVAGSAINRSDVQRIVRALEVYEITGRPISAFWSEGRNTGLRSQPNKFIILPKSRVELYEKLAQRFHSMIQQGFINEVKRLRDRSDLSTDSPSVKTVGYKQAWSYLNGEYDFEEMKYKAVVATRQLAKRQLTWLRREQGATRMVGAIPDVCQQIGDIVMSGIPNQ